METVKLLITLGISIAANAHSVVLLIKELKGFFQRKKNEKNTPGEQPEK